MNFGGYTVPTALAVKPTTMFNPYKSAANVSGSKEFLASNSLVAKFAFLLLVLVIFVVILRFGLVILSKIFTPSGTPILIDGMSDAKHQQIIHQDPKIKGSIPVLRSSDKEDGLEFTWCTWIFVDDMEYKKGQYKHIFHKGNDGISFSGDTVGMNQPNNGPGMYIDKNDNNLIVVMNTFSEIDERIVVNDIPMNKWILVTFVCDGSNGDVYINGTMTKRHKLSGVPKQNYGDVHVAMNGGFSGYIADLRYYDHVIGNFELMSLTSSGPNMKMKNSSMTESTTKYLSSRWFFQ
jgi:hypothetical protein